jgi:predicted DCC family thiol-disulfide oxidoreductase YuxK
MKAAMTSQSAENQAQSDAGRNADLTILYDGECPFCSAYVKMLRLRESVRQVHFINARDDHPEVLRVKRKGFDLQEGMVAHYGGKDYYADECLTLLAMLSSGSSIFNRFTAWMFKSAFRAKLMYPIMKTGRGMTLKLLGRKPIT